ncbi:MAG TPA: prepilin-type N-terminal cleavage/methylation domain-containing protein, partial [Syntrophales bacterium]|nr:prepilin-type N-terminal cleavage/methylation domain-containing protein [Syntrophales bacterium]
MLKRNDGFSVPELLIAMLIGLVVVGAVYSLFIMQNRQYRNQGQITEMQQNARMAMAMMIREISMAG